jgi:hypothetical protein
MVSRIAREVFIKCIDSTKQIYYYNPRTGRAVWKKPYLLRPADDVRNPIYLPEPDRAFAIQCAVCRIRVARKYCLQCKEYYCLTDFVNGHRKGKAASHRAFDMDICIQCDNQVATRSCLKCRDLYCDTCFHHLHRHGQMLWHQWKPLNPMCKTCTKYIAVKQCETCDACLCKRCAASKHEVSFLSSRISGLNDPHH